MKLLLIRLKRSAFVRQAIRRAVRQAEYRAMRDAYRKRPMLLKNSYGKPYWTSFFTMMKLFWGPPICQAVA
ncbi:MAG TPA: hypothetical protein VNX70_14140, partial [Bryobacteraceae bacterium]|nr:hypothetical protein [Bryobacteraceae bacterium]